MSWRSQPHPAISVLVMHCVLSATYRNRYMSPSVRGSALTWVTCREGTPGILKGRYILIFLLSRFWALFYIRTRTCMCTTGGNCLSPLPKEDTSPLWLTFTPSNNLTSNLGIQWGNYPAFRTFSGKKEHTFNWINEMVLYFVIDKK